MPNTAHAQSRNINARTRNTIAECGYKNKYNISIGIAPRTHCLKSKNACDWIQKWKHKQTNSTCPWRPDVSGKFETSRLRGYMRWHFRRCRPGWSWGFMNQPIHDPCFRQYKIVLITALIQYKSGRVIRFFWGGRSRCHRGLGRGPLILLNLRVGRRISWISISLWTLHNDFSSNVGAAAGIENFAGPFSHFLESLRQVQQFSYVSKFLNGLSLFFLQM